MYERLQLPQKKSDWLKPQEIAEELRFSLEAVYKWLRQGKLKGHQVAGSWRIRREDFEEFTSHSNNRVR